MGTFSDFLQSKNLTAEQLLQVSSRLERLTDEDRELRMRRAAKRRAAPSRSYEEASIPKPRSGRPLRPGHLRAALADRPVPGPVRTKFVRSVNALLEKSGREPIRAPDLFGDVPSRQGKKPR